MVKKKKLHYKIQMENKEFLPWNAHLDGKF